MNDFRRDSECYFYCAVSLRLFFLAGQARPKNHFWTYFDNDRPINRVSLLVLAVCQ